MKKINHFNYIIGLALTLLFSCVPQEDPKPGLGPEPESSDITFTYSYDEDNPNLVRFSNTTEDGFKAVWDLGNGSSATGNEASAVYPLKGNYTVKLTVYSRGGSATNSQVVNIAATNPLLLDIPSYNNLTGGKDALSGRTWIVDKESAAHLGVGPGSCCTSWASPSDLSNPIWYAAAPSEKDGKNLYDDEMTFKLDGFTYIHTVNDYFYANGSWASLAGATPESGGGGDFFVPSSTVPTQPNTWSLTDNNDGTYNLTLANGDFMGYYHGPTTYKITYLTNDEMHVRAEDPSNGLAWYQKFIRKGYVRPVIPPPYKITDLYDTFDSPGNLTYTNDSNGSITEDYDNPAPIGINTTAKVGKYVKGNGQAGEWSNVQIKLPFKMDITTRNVFKMKVFLPGYNDYLTQGAESWQSYNTLQKQVSIKLQNGDLGGNAWTTQAEVINASLPVDQWVELTFNFSAWSARTDFDKIVIQIGGEANFTGGVFFIDDFQLLP